jgi:hypothetical protein
MVKNIVGELCEQTIYIINKLNNKQFNFGYILRYLKIVKNIFYFINEKQIILQEGECNLKNFYIPKVTYYTNDLNCLQIIINLFIQISHFNFVCEIHDDNIVLIKIFNDIIDDLIEGLNDFKNSVFKTK